MSEFSALPPPPPPPPQAPAAAAGSGFDFTQPFRFTFEDPDWVRKILVGGLFQLAACFLIGVPFLLGYFARLTRNVIEGAARPLPEWDDLSEYFSEGLRLFGVVLVYMLPLMVIIGMAVVPAILAGTLSDSENVQDVIGGFTGCIGCFMVPLSFMLGLWLPAALVRAVVERRFSAAFEFSAIWNFISANAGAYVLAILVVLVVRLTVWFGLILLCVGIFLTAFWSGVVSAFAFGEVYRLSLRRTASIP